MSHQSMWQETPVVHAGISPLLQGSVARPQKRQRAQRDAGVLQHAVSSPRATAEGTLHPENSFHVLEEQCGLLSWAWAHPTGTRADVLLAHIPEDSHVFT